MLESQSALLLTEEEWLDLAHIGKLYLTATEWTTSDSPTRRKITEEDSGYMGRVDRKRQLAQKVIDAAE